MQEQQKSSLSTPGSPDNCDSSESFPLRAFLDKLFHSQFGFAFSSTSNRKFPNSITRRISTTTTTNFIAFSPLIRHICGTHIFLLVFPISTTFILLTKCLMNSQWNCGIQSESALFFLWSFYSRVLSLLRSVLSSFLRSLQGDFQHRLFWILNSLQISLQHALTLPTLSQPRPQDNNSLKSFRNPIFRRADELCNVVVSCAALR